MPPRPGNRWKNAINAFRTPAQMIAFSTSRRSPTVIPVPSAQQAARPAKKMSPVMPR